MSFMNENKSVAGNSGEMMLIADCGSTKIHWAIVEGNGTVGEFCTSGVNPVVISRERIAAIFACEVVPMVSGCVTEVWFYGAGCNGVAPVSAVTDALRGIFPVADIHVDSDMLGACRAVSARREGIVCILGTGANACRFDGERMVANVSPGGYILGDEGSGAWFGKRLAGDYIKGLLPEAAAEAFEKRFGLDVAGIIGKVYRPGADDLPPNRFLASLAPFLSANISEEWARGIVEEGFTQFFKRNVVPCVPAVERHEWLPVHFIGSVAVAFAPQLRKVAEMCGFRVGTVAGSPMDGLVRYHGADRSQPE